MNNHSYENEFNVHVNRSRVHMKGVAPRLTLRKRLKVIRAGFYLELLNRPLH